MDLIDDQDSQEMALMYKFGAMKARVPIKEEYILTPTFLVVY
jgi:hypothetical protein